ncbi:hypothetical protein M422DRAFT_46388 [Sphaerobolus stellatus SS14]|uniref:Uncharacterized protein n=1 Tax=Sphaerobolus stellatus (strain SS14) TaxID=990650 RepID=A0A0C9UTD2_SPHS4|nr:hypothetical protein M422DRAFT_46388 [Sphaerobolus stellatus SS14]
MSKASSIEIRRLTKRDGKHLSLPCFRSSLSSSYCNIADPLFQGAVEAFSLAFHSSTHTIASVPSLIGGKIDMWPVLCEGLIGGALQDGHVSIALIKENEEEKVVGVIAWVGPGEQIK